MKPREQVKSEFMAELQELLRKYDAKLEAKNKDGDVCMEVEIPPHLYPFNNAVEDEWLNIDLGNSSYLWEA